jgi:hypothetical protein
MGDETKTVKVAKYLGPTQHTRIIEAKQFNEEYFSNMKKDLVWEERNRWMVDVSDVTPEMLEYLESDPDFSIEDHEMAADEDEETVPEAPAEPAPAAPDAPPAEAEPAPEAPTA